MKTEQELKEYLIKLLMRDCWNDEEDFIVDDYCNSTLDAYERGIEDGETGLARELYYNFLGGEPIKSEEND